MKLFFASLLLTLVALFLNLVAANQNYSGLSAFDCDVTDESAPSSAFLYTCNTLNSSCQSFLIFRSTPHYSSIQQISSLTSSEAAEIALLNDVQNHPSSEFVVDKDVIVPVSCSCSGNNSNSNTRFTLTSSHLTYFVVATDTFQGLASCAAVKQENPWPDLELSPGIKIQVPLRCACPTKDQVSNGVNYLLTYPMSFDDSLPDLARRFNVTEEDILEANNLSRNENEDPHLVPGTTILIPLSRFPQPLMTVIHKKVPRNGAPPADVYGREGRRKRSKNKILELAGIGVACFLLMVSIIVAVAFVIQGNRKKKNVKKKDVGEMRKERAKEDLRFGIASCERVLKVFGIDEVKEATGNFSSRNKIKGSVYSGEFDGKVVAVKRKISRGTNISQEVNILMKINHFNVIKLHGICDDGQCFYLVSEYMESGCLKDWLRCDNQKKGGGGRWETRIQMALDVANGLHYLHNFTEPAYVHKDIKSSNVLLNSNLRAKITNFSLARAAARDSALTPHLIGTRGYLAPEYLETGEVTPKVDVYAFGVVLLELITGKEAVLGRGNEKETTLLSTTIVRLMEKGDLENDWRLYVDSSLVNNHKSGNEMEKVGLDLFRMSLGCLRKEAETRPSMEEIVSNLVKILTDLKTPKPT
ncbi:LysM domain receptor-like kinase 4 [Linum perenne]